MSEQKNAVLSVVVPNYNKSLYLKYCLESIISQTYRPLEIVIVDDCSTDRSKEIIQEYVDQYSFVKGIFLEKNQGVSNARNIGLSRTEGQYITSIDSDDFYLSKRKLELEMKKLFDDKGREGRGKIVFSSIIAVDNQGNLLWDYKTKKEFYGRELAAAFFSQKPVQLPRDYCYEKKWFLKTGGYDTSLSLYEDVDYLIKLSEFCDFYCSEEVGTAYRIGQTGLSSVSEQRHKEAISIITKRYHYLFNDMQWFIFNTCKQIRQYKNELKQVVKALLKSKGYNDE